MSSYTSLAILLIVFIVVSIGFMVVGLYYCFKSIQLADMRMPFGIDSLKVSLISVEYLLVGILLLVVGAFMLAIAVEGVVRIGICWEC